MKRMIILVMVLLLASIASALDIVEVRNAGPGDTFRQFSIFTSKSTYEKGEIATIEDFQDINAYCSQNIQVNVEIKNSAGSPVLSSYRNVGPGGYLTAFVRITQDTSVLSLDTYTIRTKWFCDGKELGQDGYLDAKIESA